MNFWDTTSFKIRLMEILWGPWFKRSLREPPHIVTVKQKWIFIESLSILIVNKNIVPINDPSVHHGHLIGL